METIEATAGHTGNQTKPEMPRGREHPVTTHELRYGTIAGEDVVFLPLSGKHGIHRDVIISLADWPWLRDNFGTHWISMVSPKDPHGRPASGRKQVVDAARRHGIHVSDGLAPLILLQRIIEWAVGSDRVFVKNGNPFDLRRSNLESVNGEDLRLIIAHFHDTGDAALLNR